MQKILVYGAGGHSKVVIDAIEKENKYEILGVIDDNIDFHGKSYYGYTVIGGFNKLKSNDYRNYKLVIAIARTDIREKLHGQVEPLKYEFVSIIHPSAQIAKDVVIGAGTMVMANAVINPGAKVGKSVVVNTGAIVEHDCIIGDFVHIGPGVHFAGCVSVGKGTFIGLGASIIEFTQVGENSIIGAGSVVIKDIPSNVIAVGVPARVIKKREA